MDRYATVRYILHQPLPELIRRRSPSSPPTTPPPPPSPTLYPWPEFRRDVLSRIFAHELDQPYRYAPPPPPLGEDCLVAAAAASTVLHLYATFVWPVVNHALHHQYGSPIFALGSQFALAVPLVGVGGSTERGTCVVGTFSLYSSVQWPRAGGLLAAIATVAAAASAFSTTAAAVAVHALVGILVATVAFAVALTHAPSIAPSVGMCVAALAASVAATVNARKKTDHDDNMPDWPASFRQLQHCAAANNTRYGFCVTDRGVYVFRFGTTTGAQLHTEHAFVAWDAAGEDQLTPTEACFFLALMAVNGNKELCDTYPPLDTFARNHHTNRKRRETFTHVTSGHCAVKVHGRYRITPGLYHKGTATADTVLSMVRRAVVKNDSDTDSDSDLEAEYRMPYPGASLRTGAPDSDNLGFYERPQSGPTYELDGTSAVAEAKRTQDGTQEDTQDTQERHTKEYMDTYFKDLVYWLQGPSYPSSILDDGEY